MPATSAGRGGGGHACAHCFFAVRTTRQAVGFAPPPPHAFRPLPLCGMCFATPQSGYVWNITFNTGLGDVAQLTPTSRLTGIGANVTTSTLQQGNTIGGTFRVRFLGGTTRRVPVTATEEELEAILEVTCALCMLGGG